MDPRAQKRQRIGQIGESVAAQFLAQKGYKVLVRNYRKPWGEIDLICEKAKTIRFVEVKSVTREPSGEGLGNGSRETSQIPEELVGRAKLEKIARTAATYMEAQGDEREYQIDVVGVILDMDSRQARCRLFEQVLSDDS